MIILLTRDPFQLSGNNLLPVNSHSEVSEEVLLSVGDGTQHNVLRLAHIYIYIYSIYTINSAAYDGVS